MAAAGPCGAAWGGTVALAEGVRQGSGRLCGHRASCPLIT